MSNLTQRLDDGLSYCRSVVDQIQADIEKMDLFLPSQRIQLDSEIDRRMADFDSRITKMAGILRRVPVNSRDFFESEIESQREIHSRLMTEIADKRKAADRDPTVRQNEAALATARKAQGVSSDLDEAIRLGRSNIQTNATTMRTLLDDRSLLENVDGNLGVIDGEAAQGKAVALRMQRRAFIQKWIGWIVVGVLAAILAMEIALKIKGVWK
jgi:hypothetical protein